MVKGNVILHDNLWMHIIFEGKVQYLHYDPNPHYMREGNAILAQQFKDAHYIWGQNAIPT
jgi:hypothetical protein